MRVDKEIIERLYDTKPPQEIAAIYNRWANTYDADHTKDSDYVAPKKCLDILKRYAPSKDARLLDVGAGTGLFGQLLYGSGYRNLVGMDVSEGMLIEARKKDVYLALHRGVLGKPLGFSSDTFDAAIAVGVFAPGNGPPAAFDELIRVIRPGGYIIFTLRFEFYEDSGFGFRPKQLELEQAGKWLLEEKTGKFQGLPKGRPNLLYNGWVYKGR
uniref:Methyltransferase domain-containing protein n=1 Tax=Candidatus Kentrum sp. TC TaxID=2126339 RepID=A0A450YK30_9GAMM|nr:MAG: Methyltransferase domain-containing protein [Candidatus Kentron sp. TC]VFK41890.1 MAG: Methyltransferase domain-containing protein [Candidatus Kentron sp. TC]VFK57660.1 MAG: Methyltransferase domain-containing protein [Candidatus Kentron sp. TC]